MDKANVYFTSFLRHLARKISYKNKASDETAGIEAIDFENKYTAIKLHFGERGNSGIFDLIMQKQ